MFSRLVSGLQGLKISVCGMQINSAKQAMSGSNSRFLQTTPIVMRDNFLQHLFYQDGPPKRKPRSKDKTPITGNNFYKGIVLKTVIRHPKKPNSGNRKCAIVKLSTGKEVCAYIPGVGHNLQEHSQVMVCGGRRRDLISVKANVMRGKLDCSATKAVAKR
uniref:28S ribosomal protein S12, mitochondrial n=1 Tax=Rhabditophanes sp. KR3021 TaxID=114890 RepID=A0AC35TXW0_9BILA